MNWNHWDSAYLCQSTSYQCRDRIRTRVRIPDPDRHQNVTICLLTHFQPPLKISCKSAGKFLRKVANRQTDTQQTTTKT